jgi:hypothetical protein
MRLTAGHPKAAGQQGVEEEAKMAPPLPADPSYGDNALGSGNNKNTRRREVLLPRVDHCCHTEFSTSAWPSGRRPRTSKARPQHNEHRYQSPLSSPRLRKKLLAGVHPQGNTIVQ